MGGAEETLGGRVLRRAASWAIMLLGLMVAAVAYRETASAVQFGLTAVLITLVGSLVWGMTDGRSARRTDQGPMPALGTWLVTALVVGAMAPVLMHLLDWSLGQQLDVSVVAGTYVVDALFFAVLVFLPATPGVLLGWLVTRVPEEPVDEVPRSR